MSNIFDITCLTHAIKSSYRWLAVTGLALLFAKEMLWVPSFGFEAIYSIKSAGGWRLPSEIVLAKRDSGIRPINIVVFNKANEIISNIRRISNADCEYRIFISPHGLHLASGYSVFRERSTGSITLAEWEWVRKIFGEIHSIFGTSYNSVYVHVISGRLTIVGIAKLGTPSRSVVVHSRGGEALTNQFLLQYIRDEVGSSRSLRGFNGGIASLKCGSRNLFSGFGLFSQLPNRIRHA